MTGRNREGLKMDTDKKKAPLLVRGGKQRKKRKQRMSGAPASPVRTTPVRCEVR